jgi:hypothetical protein
MRNGLVELTSGSSVHFDAVLGLNKLNTINTDDKVKDAGD